MTRPGSRALLAAVALTLLTCALAACSASSPAPPPRTTPDAVERAAVQEAVGFRGFGDVNANVAWVQLWTVGQFASRLQSCAGTASHGQMSIDTSSVHDGFSGIGVGGTGDIVWSIVGSGTHPTSAEAHAIINECRSITPVDDRVLRLTPLAWPGLYSYDLTVLRPCLISHGFEVGAIPDRDTFELRLKSDQPWSPYDRVTVPTRLAWYAISDACPALSPALASRVS
jgi:hypothetical protein